ncbi:MAG: 23S rRNA (adenine(2503)-C(2))-methyltransferase RlmN [bacterium]
MDMKPIYGLTRAEIAELCVSLGEPSYRATQLWRWLHVNRVGGWESMTNVSAAFRAKLAGTFLFSSIKAESRSKSADTSMKVLARLHDGEAVELVVIPAPRRMTVCVSCQVGCKFDCAFCASGRSGFTRNLEAGEIVEEVLLAGKECGEKPTHVVFMGIGEPFDNYDNVLKTIRIINDQEGLAIGARRITISTCGIIPGIQKLAGEGIQVELSVSLHAPNDAVRSGLMPVNRRYPVGDLLDACREYAQQTGRLITFEYAMIRGVNDSRAHAEELAARLKAFQCRVNLIPLSEVAEYAGKASTTEACNMFIKVLSAAGVNATLRNSRGGELNAACGQLRARRAEGREESGA